MDKSEFEDQYAGNDSVEVTLPPEAVAEIFAEVRKAEGDLEQLDAADASRCYSIVMALFRKISELERLLDEHGRFHCLAAVGGGRTGEPYRDCKARGASSHHRLLCHAHYQTFKAGDARIRLVIPVEEGTLVAIVSVGDTALDACDRVRAWLTQDDPPDASDTE